MLAAVALGLFVAGLVIRPVIAVRNGLVAMAAGDLTAHVDVTSTDEVGQMATALNEASPCFPAPRAHSGRAGGPRRSRSTHDRPARRTTRSNR
jgi:signal transduction histidine kinase